MLYDPKWEKPKVDPLSLGGLIAWLEMQPANKTYDWLDCSGQCLIDQYGAAVGLPHIAVNLNGELNQIFPDMADYATVCGGGEDGWTFGGALERARSVRLTSR